MSRGQIVVANGARTTIVEGEILPFANPGEPDYILYSNSIVQWFTPDGVVPVSPEEKADVIAFILDWARKRMVVDVE